MFDINNCTVQEAVEYTVEKIVEQGGQCVDDIGECMYKVEGEDNYHCAVGWLLDHSQYDYSKCNNTVRGLVEIGIPVPDLIKDHLEIFSSLQVFHDSNYRTYREDYLSCLERYDIDTSNPAFQAWVEMGDNHD